MSKNNTENGPSPLKRPRRAHRTSALKAKAFIRNALQEVSGEKVAGEESNDEANESDEEVYYSLSSDSSVQENDMDLDLEDENVAELNSNAVDTVTRTPSGSKKLTAVQIERNKREMFERWSEFIITPKDTLRKTSELNFKWSHTSDNQKIAICPNPNCHQKFTTRQGLTYHFQRCGVLVQWTCKICGELFAQQKTLILHHLFEKHKSELPPTDPWLTSCLTDNRKVAVKKKLRNSTAATESAAVEFYQNNYEKPVLLKFLPRSDIWIPLSELEYSMCVPEMKVSPKFKIENLSSKDSEWRQLSLFDSITTNDETFTCYVGGPVWAASWCPLPLSESDDQYVAIASCRSNDKVHTMNELENEDGLIQLWNCGQLTRFNTPPQKPYFCLGIAHDYGVIWAMDWCPGGTSWQCQTTENGINYLPRLGLIALACGDGIVRILSIPHPSSLGGSTKIYRCEPVVILDPPGTGPAFANQCTICRSISWQKTDEQKHIAAGFGSGVVAVWNLTAVSPILVIHESSSQTILRPKETWIAHGAQVNDLCWLPYSNQQMIVTVSFDRTLKVWNLNDLVTPIFVLRKSIFTKADWIFKWCGVFTAFDESYSNWQASNYVIFKDAGFLDYVQNTLTPHRGCVWDFTVSQWMNVEASVDSAGEVVLYQNFAIKHDMKSSRKQIERMPLYRMELQELTANQLNAKKGKPKGKSKKGVIFVSWNIDREKPLQRSYNEMTNAYGIVFRDFMTKEDEKIPENEIRRVRMADDMNYQRLSDYPIVSLTVVEWNPNINSFNWILTAGQSGFLRIMRYNAR